MYSVSAPIFIWPQLRFICSLEEREWLSCKILQDSYKKWLSYKFWQNSYKSWLSCRILQDEWLSCKILASSFRLSCILIGSFMRNFLHLMHWCFENWLRIFDWYFYSLVWLKNAFQDNFYCMSTKLLSFTFNLLPKTKNVKEIIIFSHNFYAPTKKNCITIYF